MGGWAEGWVVGGWADGWVVGGWAEGWVVGGWAEGWVGAEGLRAGWEDGRRAGRRCRGLSWGPGEAELP